MAFGLSDIIGGVLSPVKDIISEAIVDKDKRLEINYKLQELEDRLSQRAHDETMGQIAVNVEEAKSDSIFVAGWRPAVGWIGATALGYSFVLNPMMEFFARTTFNYVGAFPELPMEYIMTIMMGMLGFGGLRTFEKVKGVDRGSVRENPASTSTTTVKVEGQPNAGITIDTSATEPQQKKKKGLLKKVGKLF
jgi:hypothetical protein